VALPVRRDVVGEHLQGTGGHRHRAVGMVTGAASADRGHPSTKPPRCLGGVVPIEEQLPVGGDGGQAEHARAALASALIGEVPEDPPDGSYRTTRGVDHDQPRAELATQIVEGASFDIIPREPSAAVATDESGPWSTGRAGAGDQLAYCHG
jgi:hypothetical protein